MQVNSSTIVAAAITCFAFISAAVPPGSAAESYLGWNFDTGLSPGKARELLVDQAPGHPPIGSWLRLRGIDAVDPASVDRTRTDLVVLRSAGFRLVGFVRWSPDSWPGGIRRDRLGHRLALDLRDAYERCRNLAQAFGDAVDFWEIDNEPDIGFVNENPETYAAFLKACYLGFAAGRTVRGPEDRGRRTEVAGQRSVVNGQTTEDDDFRPAPGIRHPASDALGQSSDLRRRRAEAASEGGRSPTSDLCSRVLMAPLGIPPGPYFEAFARNDGLRYTDGFNYHYYGYAEDFSGMYFQCEQAVATGLREQTHSWPESASNGTAVFRTQFFPSGDGWRSQATAGFDHSIDAAAAHSAMLVRRQRAREEPTLRPNGRWLVTEGTTVEEFSGGWRFRIEGWPAGALRAPVAELPLPAGWSPGEDSLLSFQYRVVSQTGARVASDVLSPAAESSGAKSEGSIQYHAASAQKRHEPGPPRWPVRELPVFLTEYGYGSLSKTARRTAEGREAQRDFFKSVTRQIRDLGIEGAMAFLLNPYLEFDQQEFGLLMDEASGPPVSSTASTPPRKWDSHTMSPALEELLAVADEKFSAKRWKVSTPPPSPVVIDFIAREGLGMAKSFCGYFLEGEHGRSIPGEADLVVYNFGPEPISGALELEGDAWALPTGSKAMALSLAPGERCLVPVHIRPQVKRFVACPVTAWFKPGPAGTVEPRSDRPPASGVRPPESGSVTGPPLRVAPSPPSGAPLHMFEPYFRTANGNLYEAGARLIPVEAWQTYMQRVENFTPAFFGRLYQPARFLENRPVSLVFHFHPAAFPALFEVRYSQMWRFSAP